MFEETLRIDYSNYVLGMRLNFWIALLLCLGGLVWFVAIQRGWKLGRRPPPDISLLDGQPQSSPPDVRKGERRAKQIA